MADMTDAELAEMDEEIEFEMRADRMKTVTILDAELEAAIAPALAVIAARH